MNSPVTKRYWFGLVLAGVLSNAVALRAEPAPDVRRDATVEAVEQVMPCVVNIATKSVVPVRDQFEALYRQMFRLPNSYISLGSGVVIDEAGYLLTNDHVVRRAQQVEVKFNTGTNVYQATIVASDPTRDVALLKLNAAPGEKFHAIKLAREDDLLLGETVLALGNPYGLGGSVSRGILSSRSRTVPKEGSPLDIPNWLQTDAPINPGNSGGPLVNLRGELIGINVAVFNRTPEGEPVQGIGFAIPIRLVEEALADIFPTESVKSFWFGARVKVGTTPLVVTTVQPESPAGKSGLKAGDAILQVNGKEPKSFLDFADLLAANATEKVSLTVQRGTERRDVSVQLLPEASVFNARLVRDKLGVAVSARALQLGGRQFRAFEITAVEADSPAAKAGLQKGLLMVAIDDQFPSDIPGLAKLLYPKKSGEHVQVQMLIQKQNDYVISLQEMVAELVIR